MDDVKNYLRRCCGTLFRRIGFYTYTNTSSLCLSFNPQIHFSFSFHLSSLSRSHFYPVAYIHSFSLLRSHLTLSEKFLFSLNSFMLLFFLIMISYSFSVSLSLSPYIIIIIYTNIYRNVWMCCIYKCDEMRFDCYQSSKNILVNINERTFQHTHTRLAKMGTFIDHFCIQFIYVLYTHQTIYDMH